MWGAVWEIDTCLLNSHLGGRRQRAEAWGHLGGDLKSPTAWIDSPPLQESTGTPQTWGNPHKQTSTILEPGLMHNGKGQSFVPMSNGQAALPGLPWILCSSGQWLGVGVRAQWPECEHASVVLSILSVPGFLQLYNRDNKVAPYYRLNCILPERYDEVLTWYV